MASGRLGAHTSSGAGTNNVYTCPTGKTAEVNVNVLTTSIDGAVVSLFISPTGTPSAQHTIQYEKLSVISNGFERTAIILKAGEVLSYKTSTANTTVVVSGVEYTSLSNEIGVETLITTNTETVVYDNAAAKASTVNLSVSLPEGAIIDTVVVKVYTSNSNAASGYPLLSTTLRANGTTGFEKSGLPIASTEKLIIVTTGISGQLAVRVHGYKKG